MKFSFGTFLLFFSTSVLSDTYINDGSPICTEEAYLRIYVLSVEHNDDEHHELLKERVCAITKKERRVEVVEHKEGRLRVLIEGFELPYWSLKKSISDD